MSRRKTRVELDGVESILGIHFTDRDLGLISLSPWLRGFSRLEFLGDSILGLAVFSAAELAHLPRKTAIGRVTNRQLDDVFNALLAQYTSANTGDVLEALIGAIFLDIGFIRAAEIAIQLCLPECNYSEPASPNMKVPSVSSRGLALVGSAVLSAGVADDLCARFPNQSHRWLSEERSRMLSRRHLAAASAELGYAPEGDFNDGRYRASASDALEVVLGDQYFRWGWEEARSTSMRIVRLTTPEC